MNSVKKNSVVVSENTKKDFFVLKKISELIKANSGIDIIPEKFPLIQYRLQKRLTQLKITSLKDYLNLIITSPSELQISIEHLTTHKTEWFREIVHYQWLKSHFSTLRDTHRPLFLWSAACSFGREVYSLLFLLIKSGFMHNEIRLLGTDISTQALKKAVGLPQTDEFSFELNRLIKKTMDPEKIKREISLSIEKSIRFGIFNLLDDKLSEKTKFDVVFLRNVLIYFDEKTIIQTCRNIEKYIRPNGFLIIGLTETLPEELIEFKKIGKSIYQLTSF